MVFFFAFSAFFSCCPLRICALIVHCPARLSAPKQDAIMGIDKLKEALGGCWRKCSLPYTLHGRVVAVDESVLLHTFAAVNAEAVMVHNDYSKVVAAIKDPPSSHS
jgi:hypothetical protein